MTQLFDIKGKTALVTGGTRGIGLMIAEGLVRGGAKVYIASRKAEAVAEAQSRLQAYGEAVGIAADLSGEAGVKSLAGALKEQEDRLHILVNNAGATWGAPLNSYPDSAWDKVLGLNVKAVFNLTRELIEPLKAAASAEDPGRVINIGSVAGLRTDIMNAYAYSASKAAVHHLTRQLAFDLAKHHITVNAIAPGPFHTKMTAFAMDNPQLRREMEKQVPLGRIGHPEDIAGLAIFLSSRAGAYVTGQVVALDGGLSIRP